MKARTAKGASATDLPPELATLAPFTPEEAKSPGLQQDRVSSLMDNGVTNDITIARQIVDVLRDQAHGIPPPEGFEAWIESMRAAVTQRSESEAAIAVALERVEDRKRVENNLARVRARLANERALPQLFQAGLDRAIGQYLLDDGPGPGPNSRSIELLLRSAENAHLGPKIVLEMIIPRLEAELREFERELAELHSPENA